MRWKARRVKCASVPFRDIPVTFRYLPLPSVTFRYHLVALESEAREVRLRLAQHLQRDVQLLDFLL